MSIRYGYACLNVTLGPKKGGFRNMIKRTWQCKGLPYASSLTLENVNILLGIVKWNNSNMIPVYRMTSNLAPWCSEYEFEQLPDWQRIQNGLALVGRTAAQSGQRLSFHPGQFNCLASPRDEVVKNCVTDLTRHGQIMDAIGLPRTRQNKINIHLGGTYGDKTSAADRWCKNFDLLPDSVKDRITLENDDKASGFSVLDLHEVWKRTGVPIVFDYHHHKFCTGGLSEKDALHLAASTWPDGIRPVTHYSESASLREGRDVAANAHSSFVDGPVNDWGLDIDCVVEAKAKELAIMQLTTGKNYESSYKSDGGSDE